MRRLLKRNPELTRDSALARMSAQLPVAEKCALATVVMDNEAEDEIGEFASLRAQVDACLERWKVKAAERRRYVRIGVLAAAGGVFAVAMAVLLRVLML